MSRLRIAIVAVALVAFVGVGAYIVFAGQQAGGKNVTFNLTVTGAKSMSPSDITAHKSDNITINVASDTTGEVHLHGYDIHVETVAGQVVTHTFRAINTGNFEIEWESTSTHLGSLVVT